MRIRDLRLRDKGVLTSSFNFTAQSVGRLAVSLFRLVNDRRLVLPDDADLVDELSNARLRQTSPGVFRIDHDSGAHDDRVISLALAAHELTKHGGGVVKVHDPTKVGLKTPDGSTIAGRYVMKPGGASVSDAVPAAAVDSAVAASEAALRDAGKTPGGLPTVRRRGSLVEERVLPWQARSRPGWGKNRR